MTYKTIATVVTDMSVDAQVLEAAIAFARSTGGHLDVLCLGLDRTQPGFYYASANALALQDNLAQARAEAAGLAEAIEARLKGEDLAFAVRQASTQLATVTPLIAQAVRLADLAVLGKPYAGGADFEKEAVLEAALFDAGVPVLMMPPKAKLPGANASIVLAWDQSAEALSAIRASLPLLKAASTVSIAIVDPPAHGPERSDPGGALAEMLSRHGVRADVSVLARTLPGVAEVLCRHSRDCGAHLVVMGAYGHSRFREAILGGATRRMLEVAETPVLMAH